MNTNTERVALVTGASSGIGQALATALAQAGYRVYGTSRHPEHVDTSAGFTPLALDVRDATQAITVAEHVLAINGRIDLLINNAGLGGNGAMEEISLEQFGNILHTNVLGLVAMTRAVLPGMRTRRSGTIVNIGSIAGFLPMPFQAAYGASKAAVLSLTESLRFEVEPFGIRVLLMESGFVRTAFDRNASEAETSLQDYKSMRSRSIEIATEGVRNGPDPAQVAEDVLHALRSRSPQWRYKIGKDARQLALLRAILPDRFFAKGVRQRMRST